ncbi:MAG: NUDIX hydrolase [Acidimicrobiia bacterium]
MWRDFDLAADVPPPGDRDRAAVLIALYDDPDDTTRLVLIKRPDTMPTHAGHIAFPGGRPAIGDDGPTGTALREAHEEVGIIPDDVEVIGYLPPIDTVAFRLLVVPVVGRLAHPPLLVPSPREVVRTYQPSLEDLADERRWRSEDWNGHHVWFYDLEGDILWGATALMTRRLLGLGAY